MKFSVTTEFFTSFLINGQNSAEMPIESNKNVYVEFIWEKMILR